MTSPMSRHSRTTTSASMKRPQNTNTKEAAQRLVQVMSQQPGDEEDEEDDLYDFDSDIPSTGIGLAGSGRKTRNRSPLTVRNSVEHTPSSRPTVGARASASTEQPQPSSARHRPSPSLEHQQPLSARHRPSPSVEHQQPLSARLRPSPSASSAEHQQPSPARHRPSLSKPVEPSPNVPSLEHQPSSDRHRSVQSKPVEPSSTVASVEQQPSAARHRHTNATIPVNSLEEIQPSSARSNVSGRSSLNNSTIEQPSSARLVGRPNLRVKTVSMIPSNVLVPSTVSLSLKPVASGTQADSQVDKARDKKLSLDFGTFKYKELSGQQSSSALQDELDMLQEENESLLEKLRIAEERYDEAEARTRQLEKQVESFGEGVSLEARLVSRKEAELQKREVALKVAADTYGGGNEELAVLRMEVEAARGDATYALDQLQDAEHEVRSLRILTQRMILTHEEMEEVVLKRCWLARCWSLCVRYGIHAEIAEARHEYWSQFVSRPVEVILAAGRKAKDAQSSSTDGLEERERALYDRDEVTKKPDVESMFLVEQGLRELSSLKVGEAIAISMAQKRRPSIMIPNMGADELKLPAESNSVSDAFGLSAEESEDVLLKRAWLTYLWRRAKSQGLERDIADERLQFWINQVNKPNSHDAVDVERGLLELRKLGLEAKLWEESRRLIDPDSSQKTLLEIEYQILS